MVDALVVVLYGLLHRRAMAARTESREVY